MDNILKETLWKQFGASIDMLENALVLCPDNIWDKETKFWYMAYHTLFFLDYYLTPKPANFLPPPPFTLSEFDPSGAMPERVYTREELLIYLEACRNKCHDLVAGLTDEIAKNNWINDSKTMVYPVIELLLYNMRHVQHHTAQLNLLLRQGINDAPRWVSRTKMCL
ncbi:MAG: DinB family protein [Ferruginibacter sp.]